jgi:hypothetical protein
VGDELFRADAQTDKTKLIVAFYNFANSPEIVSYFSVCGRQTVEIVIGSDMKLIR